MAKTLKRKNTFKGKTVADYKGKTPREVGLKYETAGKSVADDKKMAYWLAANKPKGAGNLQPFVNSKGELQVTDSGFTTGHDRFSGTGKAAGSYYNVYGRKAGVQGALKEIGKTSRRSAMTNNGVNKAKKLRSEGFERNVRKYEFELTPKYDKKAVSKLVGRAAKVQEANTTEFRDTGWKNDRTEGYAQGPRSKLAPRITTARRDGGSELTATPARAIQHKYRNDGKPIRPYVDDKYRARKVEDLKVVQPTGLVKSLGQANKQIEKTYGKQGTYYDAKVVKEKGLSIRPERKANNGRYVWTDITAKENRDRGYRTERALTADDRKRYMKKKLAERKGK